MKYSIEELKYIAHCAYKMGKYGVKSPEEAFMRIMAGRDMGISPVAAIRGVHDIKGKDAIDATMQRAAIMLSGKCARFDVVCSHQLCTITTRRTDGIQGTVVITWTLAEAIRAELYSVDAAAGKEKTKKGAWEKYTRNLLLARATSDIARQVYPDVLCPAYTPEELESTDSQVTELKPVMRLDDNPSVTALQLDANATSLESLAEEWRTGDFTRETMTARVLSSGYTIEEFARELKK